MTSCKIFENLGVCPVIFIVPAIELLKQTQKEFERYLRFDGKPIKVGIAGGGLCDINLEGINVVTYQTALNAFDKKYIEKGNKVVDDPNVDGPKTTAQLQKDLDEATKNLTIAKNNSGSKLAELKLRLKNAVQISDKETDPKKKKAFAATALSLDKQFNKELTSLIKLELAAYKKAEVAWNNRQETLYQKSQVRNLIGSCQAFIVDEAHVASVVIQELGSYATKAYYRLGLSGTPWRMDNQEIRIEGTLGRKIIDVSASDLIELGFLVPPKIFVCNIAENHDGDTYADIYSNNIVNNWERNFRIKQFAEAFKEAGRPTIILVERREHGFLLEGLIEDSVFVPGGDKGVDDPTDEEKNYRRRMLNAVENNEIVLIATQWANVGVDAPKISVLVLAGSNQSSVTTYQQVGRVLRCVGKDIEQSISNGKPDAVIIDFMPEQKNLKTHCLMRKKVFRNERAWKMFAIK
jgi:superfamily II DNA or RNA helicase